MKVNMYAIYDKKAETYSVPFHAYNHDCAKRIVIASMSDESFLQKYPSDYRLDCIGDFEDTFGMFQSPEKKEIVCELSNLVPSKRVGDGTDERGTEIVKND